MSPVAINVTDQRKKLEHLTTSINILKCLANFQVLLMSVVSPSYTHSGFRDTEYWQGISTQTPPIQSSNLNVNENPTRIFVPESPDHNRIFLTNNELTSCESASTFANSVHLDNVSNAKIKQRNETCKNLMHSQKQINFNITNKTNQNYVNTNVSTNDMSTRPKTTSTSNKASVGELDVLIIDPVVDMSDEKRPLKKLFANDIALTKLIYNSILCQKN